MNNAFDSLNFNIKVGNVESLIDQSLNNDGYSSINNMDILSNSFLDNIDGNYHSADNFNPKW